MSDDDDWKGPGSAADWHGRNMGELLSGPRGMPVQDSDELTRIVNLPRRKLPVKGSTDAEAIIELEMLRYSRGPVKCRCATLSQDIAEGKRACYRRLKYEQALILRELRLCGGVIANFATGGGKTLCDVVGPLALKDAPLTLLLVPSNLVKQFVLNFQLIAEHFYVPGVVVHMPGRKTWRREPEVVPGIAKTPTMHVLAYRGISDIKNSEWIERLQPSAIVCDEVDALSDTESSRTMRVGRYFEQYWRTTRFAGWTGSLTDSSVSEFAHLALWALRTGSPLPTARKVIDEWSKCLDAVPNPCPAGALIRLLEPNEGAHQIRRAFNRRLKETPGFIMIEGRQIITTQDGREVGLDIREKVAPELPDIVQEALDKARADIRPDSMDPNCKDDEAHDEILVDPLEKARCVRQIASGMFYKWAFKPINGVPQDRALIQEWYFARKEWHSELRYKMLRGEPNLDSAGLCLAAARRAWGYDPPNPLLPSWRAEHYPRWEKIEKRVIPTPEAVVLHKFLVEDAAQWAARNRGIVWYGMSEFGRQLSKLTKLPMFGDNSEAAIMAERGDRTIIASIASHARGRDGLQFRFNKALTINTMASARMWQQKLARLHREGQPEDMVYEEAYLHTSELRSTFRQALRRGNYVEGLMGEDQKLLIGWQGDEWQGDEFEDDEGM